MQGIGPKQRRVRQVVAPVAKYAVFDCNLLSDALGLLCAHVCLLLLLLYRMDSLTAS